MAESKIKKEVAAVMQNGVGGGPSGGIAANAYYDRTITFNPSFTKTPVVSAAIVSSSTAGGMGKMSLAINDVTNTGFTVRIFNGDSATRWPSFTWFALSDEQGVVTSLTLNKKYMPDYSTVLGTIDTVGGSWTATDDCCVAGYIGGKNSGAAVLYVNNVEVCRGFPGNDYSGSITFPVFILVKKGDVVSTRDMTNTAYLVKAYPLRE